MHVAKTSFNGNPNIGLYAFTTDEYCLIGLEVSNKNIKLLEKVLKVPIYQLNIGGTSLLGVFLVGNKNCLLVPEICFDSELKHLDKIGIKYEVIKSKLTALGNNIVANDKIVLVNDDFKDEERDQIGKALGVPFKTAKVANLSTIGSLTVLNKKGCLLHRDATPEEIKFMVNNLNIKCDSGSVNMGNPYIKAGIITNSNGFLIGEQSSGFEQSFVDEALGFLE